MRALSRRDLTRVGDSGKTSLMTLPSHGTLNRAADTTREGQQTQKVQPGGHSLHGAAGFSSSQPPHPSSSTSWAQAGADASSRGTVPVATSAKSSTSRRQSDFIPRPLKQ